MGFPVSSTSVKTPAVDRIMRVLRRTPVAKRISHGGVFSCRSIAGSSAWSQHSWGNAIDLFPKGPTGNDTADREAIFHAVLRQTTKRTAANRGRKLRVAEIIDHSGRKIWTPERGIHAYTGTTGDHVHVSGAPLKGGRPPCAGGI